METSEGQEKEESGILGRSSSRSNNPSDEGATRRLKAPVFEKEVQFEHARKMQRGFSVPPKVALSIVVDSRLDQGTSSHDLDVESEVATTFECLDEDDIVSPDVSSPPPRVVLTKVETIQERLLA